MLFGVTPVAQKVAFVEFPLQGREIVQLTSSNLKFLRPITVVELKSRQAVVVSTLLARPSKVFNRVGFHRRLRPPDVGVVAGTAFSRAPGVVGNRFVCSADATCFHAVGTQLFKLLAVAGPPRTAHQAVFPRPELAPLSADDNRWWDLIPALPTSPNLPVLGSPKRRTPQAPFSGPQLPTFTVDHDGRWDAFSAFDTEFFNFDWRSHMAPYPTHGDREMVVGIR